MLSKRSPIFILRNAVDAADRSPYVEAARRYNYRVVAVWPSELSSSDLHRKAGLYLAAVSGCYGRLSNGGKTGHETLTVGKDMELPAQVCFSFLRSFRAPSAPGEVDDVLALPFLKPDLEEVQADSVSIVASQMKDKPLPKHLVSQLTDSFADVQKWLAPFAGLRRGLPELRGELQSWLTEQLPKVSAESAAEAPWPAAAPASVPSKSETQRLQREVKVRSAVEHLVSPTNIRACRATGSTVANCVWVGSAESSGTMRPAWPASHFCGSPQLRKLGVTEAEVMRAADTSAAAGIPLQQGDDGVCVEKVADDQGNLLLSPVQSLPETCLQKLGCPVLRMDEPRCDKK